MNSGIWTFNLNSIRMGLLVLLAGHGLMFSGCQSTASIQPPPVITSSQSHIQPSSVTAHDTRNDHAVTNFPSPTLPKKPPPQGQHTQPVFTLSANQMPLVDFLHQLATQAQLNLWIDPDISGLVTLTVHKQPLPKILARIAQSHRLHYQINDGQLSIAINRPVWRTYTVDYVNIHRTSSGRIVLSMGVGEQADQNAAKVEIQSQNRFWDHLQKDLEAIVATDHSPPSHTETLTNPTASTQNTLTSAQTKSVVIVNRESGLVSIYAHPNTQNKVETFIQLVQEAAQRQVLIEVTVVEVELFDQFQAGIDWTAINQQAGITMTQNLTGAVGGTIDNASFSVNLTDASADSWNLNLGLKLIQQYGNTKVISSPKIMAINNQTALLKVVDNEVYFTTSVQVTKDSDGNNTQETYTTHLHTVPVGFIMGITPFISDQQQIILNIRPTLSRISKYVSDPNPDLANANVESKIPVIQTREMESVLKLNHLQTGMLGGLMQNKTTASTTGVPTLSTLPWLGELFAYEQDLVQKSELVLFIRPRIITEPNHVLSLAEHHLLPRP